MVHEMTKRCGEVHGGEGAMVSTMPRDDECARAAPPHVSQVRARGRAALLPGFFVRTGTQEKARKSKVDGARGYKFCQRTGLGG